MNNTEEPKVKILTTREYIFTHCYRGDLCRINRMWLRHLDSTIGRDAPLWRKEKQYDIFLSSEFDRNLWDSCEMRKEVRETGYLLKKIRKVVESSGRYY